MVEVFQPNLFGNLVLQDLSDFELSNGFELPADYKEFLITYNGGRPAKNRLSKPATDVKWLYGMHDGPEWSNFFLALNCYNGRLPSWYIPIGCDSAGNLFIMSMFKDNKGTIAFWDHENEAKENAETFFDNLTFVANSFSGFLDLLE